MKRENNRKQNSKRSTISNRQIKHCNRCGRSFETGHLKSCPAIGKTCKYCKKPNHLEKLCRSQQVSEKMEDSDKSEDDCNLVVEKPRSGKDLKVMSVQTNISVGEEISRYIKERLNEKNRITNLEEVRIQKK